MSHSEELERPPIVQGIQFSGAKPPINTNLMNKFDSKGNLGINQPFTKEAYSYGSEAPFSMG